MNPQLALALVEAGKVLGLALLLLIYAMRRRYAKERNTATWAAMVGYHIVEIGFILAMVPSLATLVKLLPGG